MNEITLRLLRCLADGKAHSGQSLGDALGMSRAAVWKRLSHLNAWGIGITGTPGSGYRLHRPLMLLNDGAIRQGLKPKAQSLLYDLAIMPAIDSTNSELQRRRAASGSVLLAEYQSAGRGRRGHRWVAPFGASLCLSIGWRFEHGLASLSGLSLAMGVAAARALRSLGVAEIGLKWPNDLVIGQRKLGGILVDLHGESGGTCHAVCGLGVNVAIPSKTVIDQPWTDLTNFPNAADRNRLAACMLNECLPALECFAAHGLNAFAADWQQCDILVGRQVQVSLGEQSIHGQALGIDASGALLIESPNGVRALSGGQVSVRAT